MAREYETIEEATENLTEEDENILLWSAIGATAAVDIFAARIESEILDLDRQILEMQKYSESLTMTLPAGEEYLENFQIIFAEELYQELCKELGSDKIPFMAIA